MEAWRAVWRTGITPFISTAGLLALKKGLQEDDPNLIQGATTTPPPLLVVLKWPVEAADFAGYAFWQGDKQGEATVGECEGEFARVMYECDQVMGEPAACRHVINWFDDTPRDDMRRELLSEVELALSQRVAVAT